ncbi:BRCT domain-containing protein [Vogesella indigofera]|uniref:BRCT domain-containing protein n=1 Tax=Vogesella indigofera TaxID=45465 RepID=UPI00234EB95A|nr:BRCT domain-containing protein [Vogesella indigofera]MDC7699571.1 hypothetical protein [Vogesella indigofera]
MKTIEFVYQGPSSEPSSRRLTDWKESGKYIVGFCEVAGAVRTFRKDRVVQYGEGVAEFLQEPCPAPPPKAIKQPEILFTGFTAAERFELELFASEAGMKVVKSATQHLAYLCGGPNAGPTKVDKARKNGAWILDRDSLNALVETGELPES